MQHGVVLAAAAVGVAGLGLFAVNTGSASADVVSQRIVNDGTNVASQVNPDVAVEVYCDFEGGEVATGGGGSAPYDNSNDVYWYMTASAPINYMGKAIGWRAQFHRDGASSSYVTSATVSAICEPL